MLKLNQYEDLTELLLLNNRLVKQTWDFLVFLENIVFKRSVRFHCVNRRPGGSIGTFTRNFAFTRKVSLSDRRQKFPTNG